MSSPVRESEGPPPRAVILAVQLPGVSDEVFQASLAELTRLARTLGLEVVARVTQKRAALANASVVGEGKLRELARCTGGSGEIPGYSAPGKRTREKAEEDDELEANVELPRDAAGGIGVVLVDHDLTPGQTRNLEKATDAEVLDRSMVILAIFQRHARTREARMQVEIAQLSYMAPRLREVRAGHDRQRGGIGGKGAGESTLELDRRRIRDRIAELRRELGSVQREAETQRSRRAGEDVQSVALVGYTNAGKSSLMRSLTGDEVYVADQLFATLDTTVRVLKPETRPRILVSDTVGFIKTLPHDLVASFRSTLQEAREAALLLHVVDAADPAFRDQYQVTRQVLDEIGASAQSFLLVLNKADKLAPEARAALAAEFPGSLVMSSRSSSDMGVLRERIVAHFERGMQEAQLFVPFSRQRHVALLHEQSRVLEERYDENGAHVRVRAPQAVLASLRRTLQGS